MAKTVRAAFATGNLVVRHEGPHNWVIVDARYGKVLDRRETKAEATIVAHQLYAEVVARAVASYQK